VTAVTLDIYPYAGPPVADTSAAGDSFQDYFVVQVNVLYETNVVPVARILLNCSLDTTFALQSNSTGVYAEGKISPLKFNAKIIWAALGTDGLIQSIDNVIGLLVNAFVVPTLNNLLANGINLGPSVLQGVTFSNLFFSYGQSTQQGNTIMKSSHFIHRASAAAKARWQVSSGSCTRVRSLELCVLRVCLSLSISGEHTFAVGMDLNLTSNAEALDIATQALGEFLLDD
jgi:hypothetical protein